MIAFILPMTSNDVVSATNGRADLLKYADLIRGYMTHVAPYVISDVDQDTASAAAQRWNYEFYQGMYIPGLLSNLAINSDFVESLKLTDAQRYFKWTQHMKRSFNPPAMDQLENQIVLRSLAHFFREQQSKPALTNQDIVQMRNDFVDVERKSPFWVKSFKSLLQTKLYEFYLVERFAQLKK